jgi:trans-aconitate 2-methyltransferase
MPAREWDSTAYHRVSAPQTSWGAKVLSRLELRGDETVLDAGCGTGKLTKELLERLPDGRVVAVDLSINMLRTAREHLAPDFGKRVSFVLLNVLDLPFQRSFDGIFSTATFHWVLDHDRLFRSLSRALRPDGWLHAQCGGGPNLAQLRERIATLKVDPPFMEFLGDYQDPWYYSDAETAASRMRSAGFIEVETGIEPAPTQFEDAQRYTEFVSSVIAHPYLDRLPALLQSQFMQRLTAQAGADNPPYSLDYWRLNLKAKVPSSPTPK